MAGSWANIDEDDILSVPAAELATVPIRGREKVLVVSGGGVFRGLNLSNMNYREVVLEPDRPLVTALLPRRLFPLRPARDIPVFIDCDFSGLQCKKFDAWCARFVRCSFDDVRVQPNGGLVQAHFVECRLSGRWDANFSATPDPLDPAPVVEIRGNDMRGLSGVSFMDGVPDHENVFDIGGKHLIVRRDEPSWVQVLDLAESDVDLKISLSYINPPSAQTWMVLNRDDVRDATWEQLCRLTRG